MGDYKSLINETMRELTEKINSSILSSQKGRGRSAEEHKDEKKLVPDEKMEDAARGSILAIYLDPKHFERLTKSETLDWVAARLDGVV